MTLGCVVAPSFSASWVTLASVVGRSNVPQMTRTRPLRGREGVAVAEAAAAAARADLRGGIGELGAGCQEMSIKIEREKS
jgi:hypothetical protein